MLGRLFGFEMKKILINRFTWIAFLVMFAISMLDGGLFSYGIWDLEVKEAEMEIDGRFLDNELLADMVANSDEYGVTFRSRENSTYMALIDYVHHVLDWGRPLSEYSADELYDTRESSIHNRFAGYRLTEEEISFWETQERMIQKPFVWMTHSGAFVLIQGVYTQNLLCLFLSAIALSGVFAGESRHKTMPIIAGTKNGKAVTYAAKILAGMVFLMVSCALLTGTFILTLHRTHEGIEGLTAVLQLGMPYTSEALTMYQAAIIVYLQQFAAAVLLAAVALVLSEVFRNTLAVMGTMMGCYFIGYFLMEQIPDKMRTLSQIVGFIPTNFVSPYVFYEYRLIRIGGTFFKAYQFAPVLYVAIGAALVFASAWHYCRSDQL